MSETERMARAYAKLQRVARLLDTNELTIDLSHNRQFWTLKTRYEQLQFPPYPMTEPAMVDPLIIGFGGPELFHAIESISDEFPA